MCALLRSCVILTTVCSAYHSDLVWKMLEQKQELTDMKIENYIMRLENRLESGLARMERMLEQLGTKQDQLAVKYDQLSAKQQETEVSSLGLATKEQLEDIQQKMADITRLQSHLQLKQDQLASKQDLLQSTISNDRPAGPSVVSSPMVSPPLGTNSTWNSWQPYRIPVTPYRSKSLSSTPAFCQPTEFTKGTSIEESVDDELYSFLDDFCSLPSSPHAQPVPLGDNEASRGVHASLTPLAGSDGGIDSGVSMDANNTIRGGDAPGSSSQTKECDWTSYRPVSQMADRGGDAPGSSSQTKEFDWTSYRPVSQMADRGGYAPGYSSQMKDIEWTTPRPVSQIADRGGIAPGPGSSQNIGRHGALHPPTLPNTKLKSADDVMHNHPDLCNTTNVTKLATRLAQEAFFGNQVLVRSSVTGKVGAPLDEQKLEMLQTVLRTKIFPDMTIDCFREAIWPQCKNAIAALCKRLRKKQQLKVDKN